MGCTTFTKNPLTMEMIYDTHTNPGNFNDNKAFIHLCRCKTPFNQKAFMTVCGHRERESARERENLTLDINTKGYDLKGIFPSKFI